MSNNVIRLYRFYNVEKSKHGEPFTLCDRHVEEMERRVAGYAYLEKLADLPVKQTCVECERQQEETRR